MAGALLPGGMLQLPIINTCCLYPVGAVGGTRRSIAAANRHSLPTGYRHTQPAANPPPNRND